jgi:imidazolonepropionase-like amidohydrolase
MMTEFRRMRFVPSVMLYLVSAAACSAPEPEAPIDTGITVFEGARVIVGDGSDPIEDATFVVEGDRFVQVGEGGTIEIPDGSAHVDLSGRTVIPALVDTHTHLSRTRDELVDDLRRRAYWGVGVAMSLGQDTGDVPFDVREETIPDAARYRTAGRGITMPEPGRSDIPYWITTEEEARAAVRELAELNVDLVKIWVDDRGGQYEKLTPELYGAVIDEAHQHRLRVTAHVFTLEDAKGLLRAGVDAFAHGVRDMDVDDEVVALLRERPDVILVPNLPNRGVAEDLDWLRDALSADELAAVQETNADRPQAQETFGIQARNLARLSAEGVRIGFGTDGNVAWSAHVELADMVAAGMTPHDVLVAATGNSAELLGVSDGGTVAAGQSADFVVLAANPLDDITNTRQINAVYLRGIAVDRDALRVR